MNPTRFFLTTLLAIILTGCAHPIKITPDTARLDRIATAQSRVPAKVGYYIPPELGAVEITTPGGGGDNVRYFPYRDMEAGFEKMLTNVFTDVVKLSSPIDSRDGIGYVIVPTVLTSSGGSGFFTWPPTNFTVDLTSQLRKTDGKIVASPRVVGTGSAETGERLSAPGIAGSRAMEDALHKMQASLLEIHFSDAPKASSPSIKKPVEERLAHIKELKDRGLITQQEYDAKRRGILEAL